MKKKYLEFVLIITLLTPILSFSISKPFNQPHTEYSEVSINQVVPPAEPGPFIYGTSSIPPKLDPLDSWAKSLEIIIDQVAETLFTYDLSHPSLLITPLLATGYDLEPTEKLNYTIYLRQGVTFHDGSEFNSTVAKWNFDRMEYWWNFTGSLPGFEQIGEVYPIFHWEDEILPIWNRTEIVDENTIKFVLNKPHSGFIHYLTRFNTALLSMESTPFLSLLTLGSDQIIGTGPFVFDYYIASIETRFYAFENYWRGKAQIEEIIFVYIFDKVTLNNAMLAGQLDFLGNPLPSLLDAFKAIPGLNVIDDGKTNSVIRYLAFNNNTLDTLAIRKALSYAINYTKNIDALRGGTSNRLKSPIPPGIAFSNDTFNYPSLNITKARQFMQNLGHGTSLDPNYPGSNETEWDALADAGPYNFSMWTMGTGDSYRNNLFDLCNETFRKIGINLYQEEIDWVSFITTPNLVDMWALGFGADYNDPSNYVNFLFSNKSKGNFMGTNDSYLQNLIELGPEEHDPTLREAIYDEIQRYLVEDLMPMAWLDVAKIYSVYKNELTGFSQNVMQRPFFYEYEWDPYNYEFTMTSPGDVTFTKDSTGNTVSWTMTANNVNNPHYEIYINNSLDTSNSWQSTVPVVIDLDAQSVDSYAYVIVGYNGAYVLFDLVIVTVEEGAVAGEIPGYSIFFIIGISFILTTYIYKKQRKKLQL
ncbi:MAG: ABC transporter substrate-binding protein [Promethearchaeota archaeon]|jgi:peptide/nickel transport system substrate-binding protein